METYYKSRDNIKMVINLIGLVFGAYDHSNKHYVANKRGFLFYICIYIYNEILAIKLKNGAS